MEIVPFSGELLDQAAQLLALRQRRDRASLPQLPARFEAPAEARAAIEAALRRKHARGFAALDDGRLVAYLIGDMQLDNLWGRSGWVRNAGCAYDPDAGVGVVRDLYAALGARWVDFGVFFHFALVPVADPDLLHAWFSLSFGIEQVHALADLEGLELRPPAPPAGVEIRRAGPEDRRYLEEMSDVIWRHQVQAPVWGIHLPETVDELRRAWGDLVDEEGVVLFLAFQGGRVVGSQGHWPAEEAGDVLFVPDKGIALSVAGTREAARGRGIGTLLTEHVLAHGRSSGYRWCETDWRSTNLLASRFWPRRGFRPVAYRLVRRIDPRIAWARG
jgi:ribosomal protein S18 acetylase RimI-like enzyme